MAVGHEEFTRIYHEALTKSKPTDKSPEALKVRKQLDAELAKMRKEGHAAWPVQEWPESPGGPGSGSDAKPKPKKPDAKGYQYAFSEGVYLRKHVNRSRIEVLNGGKWTVYKGEEALRDWLLNSMPVEASEVESGAGPAEAGAEADGAGGDGGGESDGED